VCVVSRQLQAFPQAFYVLMFSFNTARPPGALLFVLLPPPALFTVRMTDDTPSCAPDKQRPTVRGVQQRKATKALVRLQLNQPSHLHDARRHAHHKPRPEDHICVVEHSLLQRHNDELRLQTGAGEAAGEGNVQQWGESSLQHARGRGVQLRFTRCRGSACDCPLPSALPALPPHLREVLLDHAADVLGVAQVQCCIHLIQDVDGCGLEEEHCEDEGKRQQ
jgi:hypothetical protein